jgi:hypothetical protein
MTTVALVSLGRSQAMGEVRRVASWRQVFAAAGADVVELRVTPDRRPHLDGTIAVATGRAVPERLAWSGSRLRTMLADAAPDVVIAVSTRAFDARALDGPWRVVLDQVDSLARSYHDRAALVDGQGRKIGYHTLAAMHARVERRLRATELRRVAAGWTDAVALGAEWVPIMLDDSLIAAPGAVPDHDVLFFGTLRYPPNVDALERMAGFWPQLLAARPGTTGLVAGSAPTERVQQLCARHGWDLVADFASLAAVTSRARVAIAPLTRVAGIQIKVLDAASLGVPQVVTPAALEGFDPELPLRAYHDDEAFVAEVVRILDDTAAAAHDAALLETYVRERYGVASWVPWAREVLDHGA